MANLTHLWKVGQNVRIRNTDIDTIQKWYTGYVQEVHSDHLIVFCNKINHTMWFEENMNLDCLYPEYNFRKDNEL